MFLDGYNLFLGVMYKMSKKVAVREDDSKDELDLQVGLPNKVKPDPEPDPKLKISSKVYINDLKSEPEPDPNLPDNKVVPARKKYLYRHSGSKYSDSDDSDDEFNKKQLKSGGKRKTRRPRKFRRQTKRRRQIKKK